MRILPPVPLALVALLTVLAGCIDDAPEAAAPGEPDDDQAATPAPARGTPAGDGSAEQAHAPEWSPGQWWRWAATPRDTDAYEARTAIARIEDGHYLIGWGSTEEGLRSQFLHFIPNGPVSMDDLSWGAHHDDIVWLDFPLHDGKTWDGGLWLDDMAFTATATDVTLPGTGMVPGFHIHGRNDDDTVTADIWWATEAATMTGLDFYLHDPDTPWFALRLMEQGTDAQTIHLLHSDMHSATFSHLPSQLQNGQTPMLLDTIEIDEQTTHLSVGCYLGGAPGHYAFEISRADESSAYGCRNDQSDDADGVLMLDWGPVSAGTWTVSHRTIGEGSLFVELFLLREEVVTP